MHTTRHRPRTIVDEIHRIRAELHHIAVSLHPQSDTHQRAVAEKKITALEQRLDELEARQKGRL